jgi:hypothetical protein
VKIMVISAKVRIIEFVLFSSPAEVFTALAQVEAALTERCPLGGSDDQRWKALSPSPAPAKGGRKAGHAANSRQLECPVTRDDEFGRLKGGTEGKSLMVFCK